MGSPDVYMDIPAVRQIAKTFGTLAETLQAINKVLETLSTVLKATAFIGLVGGYAVAMFIDNIRPQIEKVADQCEELNSDVDASVDAYERGDAQGATRFH